MHSFRAAGFLALTFLVQLAPGQWIGYGHDAQHTGDSVAASQALNSIHWQTPVDTILEGSSGELLIHYGTPIVTAANTVLVPQRNCTNPPCASASNPDPNIVYQVNAFNGSTGALLYTLSTAYTPPPHDWIPSFGTTLGLGSAYYYPGPGGTVYYRDTPDSLTGNSGQLAFYGLSTYEANQSEFNGNVMISTPITADRFGNIYFGFIVTGTVILPGGATLTSGLARISAAGAGSWVSAYTLGGGASSPIFNYPDSAELRPGPEPRGQRALCGGAWRGSQRRLPCGG